MADPEKTTPPAKETTPAFKLPAELEGKSAEDVARYYSTQLDARKDYDELKTRASSYEKLGKPEELTQASTFDKAARKALSEGKVLTVVNGQIMAVDPKTLTPAERKEAKANTHASADGDDEWLNDWEVAEPRDQARRMSGYITKRMNEIIAQKEQEYNDRIQVFQNQLFRQQDVMLNMIADVLEHPTELKIRNVLKLAGELGAQNPNIDPVRAAIDQLLSPGQIQSKADEIAATKIAEQRLADENARKARPGLTSTNRSPLMEALRGANADGRVTNDQIISGLRDKGLLQ